jgi:hypothetical protein
MVTTQLTQGNPEIDIQRWRNLLRRRVLVLNKNELKTIVSGIFSYVGEKTESVL